ncbi:hypothetical protein [Aureibacter tunicatorum]|uniref:Uncharacterized protein n=1 Tax=Aureibacter tunicatorum TaxID=866807 RepID=A0AAE3XTY1_9BACT|nr:hypothetical protein [Aureibacter tunicatorum]MDR6242018.1 hypothetical protein [Aureibacter tunicatorum]BDD07137.1 hypothetical protein AUTU_46200 [Aureibacter tunicatorum]
MRLLILIFIIPLMISQGLGQNYYDGVSMSHKLNEQNGLFNAILVYHMPDSVNLHEIYLKQQDDRAWQKIDCDKRSRNRNIGTVVNGQKYEWYLSGKYANGETFKSQTAIFAVPEIIPSFENLPDVKAYYVELARNKKLKVDSLVHKKILVSFDTYGFETKYTEGSILNEFKEVISNFYFENRLGRNYHIIDLEDIDYKWEDGKVYELLVKNQLQDYYGLSFRLISYENSITLDINALPLNVECEFPQANRVKYRGSVENGEPPYNIIWKVSKDLEGKDLLYKPMEMTVNHADSIPSVDVQKPLGYYVTLYARDVCGIEEFQIIQATCSDKEDSEATLNIELWTKPNTSNNKSSSGK